MLVVHANWFQGHLHLWGESVDRATTVPENSGKEHPFAASTAQIRAAIERRLGSLNGAKSDTVTLLLPHSPAAHASSRSSHATTLPSSRMAGILGHAPDDEEALTLEACEVPTIRLEPGPALMFLLRLADLEGSSSDSLALSHAMHWWMRLAQFTLDSVVDQRVIPTVLQRRDGSLAGQWRPWLNDADADAQVADLIASMPAAVRAVDTTDGHAWPIVDSFLGLTTDALIRSTLVEENFDEAIEDFSTTTDPHAGLLSGLLGRADSLRLGKHPEHDLMRSARGWLAVLDEVRSHQGLRLRFDVREPDLEAGDEGTDAKWRVSFGLVDPEDPEFVTDAETILLGPSTRRSAARAARTEELAELLLKELGRASRIWTELEDALEDEAPCGIDLSTRAVHTFLRDIRPVLLEAGFFVEVPEWWGQPTSRISARLLIDAPETPHEGGADGSAPESLGLGLQAMVAYRWQVALGGQSVSVEMLEKLSRSGSPLLRVGGAWVDLRPEDIATAVKFFRDHPGGNMTLVEALRMAHGIDGPPEGLPVTGVQATGWVAQLLDAGEGSSDGFAMTTPPECFRGTLRPYQLTGLSWLAFLDRLGLGACLADDMGLGKTIQLIALLQHERAERAAKGLGSPGPTLLIAPMSVLGNWRRELARFAPELKVHTHHGIDRPTGDEFTAVALHNDLIVTTYAIVVRDRDTIQRTPWRRVVLDEAQHIKNPPTKQTAAIRGLNTRHRVALTGTPVENRLAELWSIMEFCSPGYLGTNTDFRRRFAAPIERNRDAAAAQRLRALVRPFILRRLKTDPTVISDLPPLIESRQSIPLTQEQVELYEAVVADMLAKVDQADGIRRRGLVLSALVKLKQICNHPAHFLREGIPDGKGANGKAKPKQLEPPPEPDVDADDAPLVPFGKDALDSLRSGKTQRLIEMLEEVVAAGDRALVFTQYRQMGHLLVSMIRHAIDVEALFLHGGTPQAKRDAIVERFQEADGSHPIFVLSLKAGGVGLNLTAANHVFHFDRWWNPAVENQATDRAFRIGQTRTVNVHKFVCTGTLEERIDQMIEQKTELATQIIGAGDAWLTEMSTTQLRDLLSLRPSALEGAE